MSAASFNKITTKAGNSGYGKNPEKTKILEKTASPTSAPLLDAAKKFLKDPYNTAHTAAKRLKLKNYIRIPKNPENRVF